MQIRLDNGVYKVDVIEKQPPVCAPEEEVSIAIPCHNGYEITRLCVDAIHKFTDRKHRIWVVDNASDRATVRRLKDDLDANLILNHTLTWRQPGRLTYLLPWFKQEGWGSIANGAALELAAKTINTHYLFVMHSDSLPIREGWLEHLLGKLNEQTRGAAFRQDKIRVHAMHCSGFLFDFSLFEPLNMSFLPNIPTYDAADLVTIRLREAGFGFHLCRNNYNDPGAQSLLPADHWLQNVGVDVAFDDDANPVFVHLGRGTLRVIHPGVEKTRRSIHLNEWLALARANLGLQ